MTELEKAARQLIDAANTAAKHFGYSRLGGCSLDDSNVRVALHKAADALTQALATTEPVQVFLVRDVAALLGASVPDVCKALAHLGHGQRSTNMEITPDEALAVAKSIAATTEPEDDAQIRAIGEGLRSAHDHIEMHKLERSHCKDAARIREGLAAFAAYKRRGDFVAPTERKGEPGLFATEVQPQPLRYSLDDYHRAPSQGPLHATWQDKPHRLLYDLIAALAYYTSPQVPEDVIAILDECRTALMEFDRDSDYELIERIDAIDAARKGE